jgi:hypothetical protein
MAFGLKNVRGGATYQKCVCIILKN